MEISLEPGYFWGAFGVSYNDLDLKYLLWGLLGLLVAGWILFWPRRRDVASAKIIDTSRPRSLERRAGEAHADTELQRTYESRYWTPLEQTSTVVKEMDSIEEEVEVFLLTGRMDMATVALRQHVDANANVPAHVWMTLLDLLQAQGMRQEFDKLAAEIKSRFNVVLPDWEEGTIRSGDLPGLERVPHVLHRITGQWNAPGCLAGLRSLTLDGRKGKRTGFHQEAFRELLMLIGVLEWKAKLPPGSL